MVLLTESNRMIYYGDTQQLVEQMSSDEQAIEDALKAARQAHEDGLLFEWLS